jgi:eukaryotic-like serine/threonine-protein kinase
MRAARAARLDMTAASQPRVTLGQHSVAGLKERNDDSYGIVVPTNGLLETHGIAMAIADGMSTSEGAKEASELCIKSFLEDYYCTHASWSVKKSVGVVLTAVNNWLYAQGARKHGSEKGMVSTFSGVVLKGGIAHLFHAGDCRINRIRDGVAELLTRDHRVRVGRGREMLARAFGIDQNLEIDYRAEPMEAGDVLVFTTDGVHDFRTASEIATLLATHKDNLDVAARAIVAAALANGSTDNLTCQIVRVDSPGFADELGHLQKLTALPFPPELAPGQTFDGFRIVRELHASNRTQVYLALDEVGQEVVLKTPSVNFEDDPAYIEQFAKEEWIGRLVASPHVLKVLPRDQPRRHLYTVTEFCDGQTLRAWMTDHPKPDLETVRAIVEQIAKGLRAFHRKDIIHRDLKPENVLIDKAGVIKIIDFGSSFAAGFGEMATVVKQPALAGTIDYTAPEYHYGERPTNRSDIFALGVIAYEMLTGTLPYGRGFSNRRDVAQLTYISARAVREDLPPWIDAALAHAVAKAPGERTDALSALVENIQRPNSALNYDRPLSALERNPVAFWQTMALVLLILNIAQLIWRAR